MSNLIELFTTGKQNPEGRFRVALGEASLIYGHSHIASITFRREDGVLVLYHMAIGVPETRHVVAAHEEIHLQVDRRQLQLVVQAVTPTHVVIDAMAERGADVALVLAANA